MNVLVLSPAFPPPIARFCAALRARGVTVLGVGDDGPEKLTPALRACLTEYVHLPTMWSDHGSLRHAVAGLISRHGAIDRLDSLGEHWMGHEGRLRDELGVPGLGAAQTDQQRRKSGMAELYDAAGIRRLPGLRVEGADDLRRAVEAFALPLLLKPDTGSGSARTFAVRTPDALDRALAGPLGGYLAQPFVEGDIVTFDGLTNADGEVVFCTSHAYDAGIMEVLTGRLDGYYYSLREIPPELEALGRRAVAAFDVRARFFHQEFFRLRDGSYVALEMNLRPPGGFTTDMMNAAGDFDVYALWAGVITGERWADFRYARAFHTAHAGRRRERRYALPHDALVAELGDALVGVHPVPPAFADTMGDDAYLLRHAELGALLAAIHLVQRPDRETPAAR
ncbi:MAG: hypothetical protein JWM10_2880 [Myxococcaceae bacterium]|nr:hypothetical protein [Myxococcaceae bacterium]